MRRKVFALLASAAVVVGAVGARDAVSARHGVATAKEGWSQPQPIRSGANGGVIAASPRDPLGRVYAAWLEGGKVMLSTWHAGTWGTAAAVAAPGSDASGLTLAVADDGSRVLAAWAEAGEVYATVVGSGVATDVSRSAKDSAYPQAAYLPALGFVVVWREVLAEAPDEYASERALVEAHLQAAWSAPTTIYRPVPTYMWGIATVSYVGPAATDGTRLVIPFATLDTYQVREYATAVVWDGTAWLPPPRWAGGGRGGEGGVGLPGGQPVIVFHDYSLVRAVTLATGAYATLATDSTQLLGVPVAATADGTMFVAWRQPSGLTVRSSSDGLAWSPAATIVADGGPVSAAAAAGGSVFIAYVTTAGDLFSVHLGTPPSADFGVAAAPSSRTVTAGGGAGYTVTVTGSGGFDGPVTLSVGGLPAGATGSFGTNPTASTSTLTVATSASTPAGSYPLTVTGANGTLSRSATASLVVQAAPPAPTPTPPSGGGGGGGDGGGGAVPPELGVTGTASPQPQTVGDSFTYTFTIANSSIAASAASWLNVTLPAGVQLLGSKVNRGPGCTAAGQQVSCFLDFFPGTYTDTVLLFAAVTAVGDLTTKATLVSQPADSNPANDTATVTLQLPSATPPSTPPAVPPTTTKVVQPSIRIVSTAATKQHTVVVRVAIRNWPIFKSRQKGLPANGGYWLIWVDGKLNAASRLAGSGATTKLHPGTHYIWVELVRDDKTPLKPRARSTTIRLRVD